MLRKPRLGTPCPPDPSRRAAVDQPVQRGFLTLHGEAPRVHEPQTPVGQARRQTIAPPARTRSLRVACTRRRLWSRLACSVRAPVPIVDAGWVCVSRTRLQRHLAEQAVTAHQRIHQQNSECMRVGEQRAGYVNGLRMKPCTETNEAPSHNRGPEPAEGQGSVIQPRRLLCEEHPMNSRRQNRRAPGRRSLCRPERSVPCAAWASRASTMPSSSGMPGWMAAKSW